ncbi:MAG TPA: thioredoxin domain-containing protein [Rhizomicrobium sp.]|jgi:protein-disulfide isomerase
MNRRQLLIGLVVLAVIAIGVVAYMVFSAPTDDTGALASGGTQYKVTITSGDRTQGNSKAPITMVEYAAPTCPHCARFDMTLFPYLKKNYIDTGKVYYVFRVFPLSQVDIAAESMARCLPADNYFQFIDLLFRNQPKWDPDGYQIQDVHSALVDMGRIAGMNSDQVDKCIGDQAANKRAADVGAYAQTTYGINGTPTFLVNGQTAPPFESTGDIKTYLDSMLAKK